jgi:hypothetical protein
MPAFQKKLQHEESWSKRPNIYKIFGSLLPSSVRPADNLHRLYFVSFYHFIHQYDAGVWYVTGGSHSHWLLEVPLRGRAIFYQLVVLGSPVGKIVG